MRSNEIPAEALHKVGSDLGDHAPYLSEAYVSCGLREPEMFNDDVVKVTDLAEACLRTRTAEGVIQTFDLEEHPLVKQRRDEALLAGKVKSRAVTHRDIRSIFYRSDAVSMYNKLEEYRAFIKKNQDHITARLNDLQENPLEAVEDTEHSIV